MQTTHFTQQIKDVLSIINYLFTWFTPDKQYQQAITNIFDRKLNIICHFSFVILSKGQLISKCLFGIFNSPKKRTKQIDFTAMAPQIELSSNVLWEN